MCCKKCHHFIKCKKAKKTNPHCCHECIEYDFCPFTAGDSSKKDLDPTFSEGEIGIDMFEGDDL